MLLSGNVTSLINIVKDWQILSACLRIVKIIQQQFAYCWNNQTQAEAIEMVLTILQFNLLYLLFSIDERLETGDFSQLLGHFLPFHSEMEKEEHSRIWSTICKLFFYDITVS